MKLFLVRHGESVGNKTGFVQGHEDHPLTKTGIDQVVKIARRLEGERIDLAYSSDLRRAARTFEEIVKLHPEVKKIEHLKELRERGKGIYEGKPREVMYSKAKEEGVHYFDFTPEGGKSIVDFHEGMKSFSERIKNEARDHNVLIVSHMGPIACTILHALGRSVKEYRDFSTSNAGLWVLEVGDKGVRPVVSNSLSHLES
jgi:broad specificity phosphatase PhoE